MNTLAILITGLNLFQKCTTTTSLPPASASVEAKETTNRKIGPDGSQFSTPNFFECRMARQYVDKTLIIRELLNHDNKAIFFSRPRGFGKSLNLDTCEKFFSIHNSDLNRVLFAGGVIPKNTDTPLTTWKTDKLEPSAISFYPEVMNEQGQYPVIRFSLAFSYSTVNDFTNNMNHLIQTLFAELHKIHNFQCSAEDAPRLETYNSGNISYPELKHAINFLSKLLHDRYNKATVILIDDFDALLQEAFIRFGAGSAEYTEVAKIFGELMFSWLKENEHLRKAVLAGILPMEIPEFANLNFLGESTVLDSRYSGYFGFTGNETKALLEQHMDPLKYNFTVLTEYYGGHYVGYYVGKERLFCPWSIVNFIKYQTLENYWSRTGNLSMFKKQLQEYFLLVSDIVKMWNGEFVVTHVFKQLSFMQLYNRGGVSGFLVHLGYLNAKDIGNSEHLLNIANKEILQDMKKQINEYFLEKLPTDERRKEISNLGHALQGRQYNVFLSGVKMWLDVNKKFNFQNKDHFQVLMKLLLISTEREYEVLHDVCFEKGKGDTLLVPKNQEDTTAILFGFQAVSTKKADTMNQTMTEKIKYSVWQIIKNHHDVAIFEARNWLKELTMIIMCFCRTHVLAMYHTTNTTAAVDKKQFRYIEL